MKKDRLTSKTLLRVLFLTVGAVIAGVFSLASAVQPALADHATLALSPTPLVMNPDTNGILDVWLFGLDDSEQLAGYEIALRYDPSVIIVEDVTGGGAQFDITPVVAIDNEIGRVSLGADQIQVGAIEDALIARIKVRAVGALGSSTDLTISSVELIDRTGQQIAVTAISSLGVAISNAAVIVGTSSIPQGSSTTIPVTVVFAPTGGLAGYNISVRYDSSIIAIDGVSPGEAPFTGAPIFSLNEEQSFINIVGFHGERPGPVGTIVALNIRVTGIKKGQSRFELSVKDLVDAVDAASWPAVAVDGMVRVLSEAARRPGESEIGGVTPQTATGARSVLDGAVIADLTPNVSTVIALPDIDVTVTIPAGAVTESGFVTIRPFEGQTGFPAPPNLDLGTTVEVNFLDSEGSILENVVLLKQAILKMGVSITELETSGPDGILIQRYVPVLGRWLPLASTIDTEDLAVSATTNQVNLFRLTFEHLEPGTTSEGSEEQPGQDESAPPQTAISSGTTEGRGVPEKPDILTMPADRSVSLVTVALVVVLAVAVAALGGLGHLYLRNRKRNVANT